MRKRELEIELMKAVKRYQRAEDLIIKAGHEIHNITNSIMVQRSYTTLILKKLLESNPDQEIIVTLDDIKNLAHDIVIEPVDDNIPDKIRFKLAAIEQESVSEDNPTDSPDH